MNELRLPRVKRSLCGCSLETGAKIVGYLHMSGIVGGFLTTFVLELSTEVRRTQWNSSRFSFLFFRDDLMLAAIFNTMVVAAFYVYGIKMRDTTFMEPLLVSKGAMIILDLFNLGLSVLARAFQFKSMTIFYELVKFGADSYMFTILHSFYQEVRDTGTSVCDEEEPR